jgi:hypothetical protein
MFEGDYDRSNEYVVGSRPCTGEKEDLTWIIQGRFYHHLVAVEYRGQGGGGDLDWRLTTTQRMILRWLVV